MPTIPIVQRIIREEFGGSRMDAQDRMQPLDLVPERLKLRVGEQPAVDRLIGHRDPNRP